MKIKEHIATKRWYFLILILLVIVGTAISPLEKSTKPIKDWMNAHIGFVIILGLVALIGTWFKDKIRKALADKLMPLFTQVYTHAFVRFGAYDVLLNKYRQTLQKKLKEVGLTQQLLGEGVDLEKNYISIQLSKEEYKRSESDDSDSQTRPDMEEPKMERSDVHTVLTDETTYDNRIAIIGDPGSGKTTLLQYLAYQCTKGEGVKPIPVLITLTAYVQHGALSIRSYIEVLFEENDFPKVQDFLEGQLKKGNLLILFDGFDEVEIDKRAELKRQIKAFANHPAYLQNKFVITSRPIRDAVFENFRHLEVMSLTPKQRQTFLESKIDNSPGSDFDARRCTELFKSIEEHDRIRKLAENPLLLTFLYHVYKYNLELPRRRVELYRLSVNLMLDWDMETNRPTHIQVKNRDAKKEVLKKVAYYYHTHQKREIPESELIAQVRTYLPDSLKEKFTAEGLLREIENSSGILRHRTAESYQFIHLTFQEYLTADYMNDNREGELPKLMKRLHNPWWREVTLLLASTMGNATSLIYRILDYRQQAAEESEKRSCLFIAFNCLFEAVVDADARNQVLDAFVKLPHHQVLEVIGDIVGPIEAGNEDLETLFVNILNSPYESVQAWGLSFLNSYRHVAENSERLTKRVQEISYQAFQKLPDEIQAHILGVLPLEQIAEAIWGTLTTEPQIVAFDYLHRLYAQCEKATLTIETHQKLLLSQSAHLIRFLIGGLFLQSTPQSSIVNRQSTIDNRQSTIDNRQSTIDNRQSTIDNRQSLTIDNRQSTIEGETPLKTPQPFFTPRWNLDLKPPDGKYLPSSPTFTADFIEIWQSTILRFTNILQGLVLALYPDEKRARELARVLEGTRGRNLSRDGTLAREQVWTLARTLARELARARELDRTLARDVAQDMNRALETARARARARALALARARDVNRARSLARSRAMDWALTQTWELAMNLVQGQDLDLPRARALALNLDAALALDVTLVRALEMEMDREAIEFLALAQDLILTCAMIHAQEQIRDGLENIRFILSFLETAASQNHESAWYILMLSQHIHAAPFLNPDSELSGKFQQEWEQRSASEIAPYQFARFVNLATLLHTFGVTLDGTFFEKVLKESANSQAGWSSNSAGTDFVPHVSYLLHRSIAHKATAEEQEQFWKLLRTGGAPIEQEWLKLSGLTLLRQTPPGASPLA